MTPITAALAAIAMMVAPPRADNIAAAKRSIQTAYDKTNAAMARKDVKGAAAFMAANYSEDAHNGRKLDRRAKVEQLSEAFKVCRSIKNKSTIERFALSGNTASVLQRDDFTMLFIDPKTHKAHKVIGMDRERDTWTRAAQGWRWARSVEVQSKLIEDGKVVEKSP